MGAAVDLTDVCTFAIPSQLDSDKGTNETSIITNRQRRPLRSFVATHSQTTLHMNEVDLASCTRSHYRHLGGEHKMFSEIKFCFSTELDSKYR